MSRLGKQPIELPQGVSATYTDGVLEVAGPKGTLQKKLLDTHVAIKVLDNVVTVTPRSDDESAARALWGTYASHVRNLVTGVTEGFQKVLEIEGVGYRAEAQGQTLTVNVGYSHPVIFTVPEGVTATVEKNTITISGSDKEVVGQFAANVRASRPPEPYKGKGIHYEGEYIIRKQGKKAV